MKYLWEKHIFFVRETPKFIGRYKNGKYGIGFTDKLYYPIAYSKFMWDSFLFYLKYYR